MKRTRRIEIIRYSRRVTATQGDDTPTAPADSTKLTVIDITPGVEEVMPSAPEQWDTGSTTDGVSTHETPQRLPAFRLRDLLRPRR